jgi:adenosylcobalamin-dependent ribonucleoside-triphosphate reductase
MNIIGQIVVSGNVRRSAQIAIGDCKDLDFLREKRWDLGGIPNHRAYSNNSVVCNDINEIINNEEFWCGYEGKGEPYGLINLGLSQKCGRLGETKYADPTVAGYNPCAEISLSDKETCCLSELYLPNITSADELWLCTKYVYRICKHSLTLPCTFSQDTEDIVHANMRIGIGVTGYLQATEEQKNWLSANYVRLRAYDDEYSMQHGFPKSIKLTTCKPSGTLSILAGVTAGIHPGYAQYYIRRVRIASESPLIEVARKHGYDIEYSRRFDGTHDTTTQIVSFPYSLPEGTVFGNNCSAIDQLEYVRRLQTEWADNSISVTVTYKPEELPVIKDWLREHYNNNVKTVSFLLYSGHGFDQAPIEPITKEVYNTMMSACQPITSLIGICSSAADEELATLSTCAGGVCPVR